MSMLKSRKELYEYDRDTYTIIETLPNGWWVTNSRGHHYYTDNETNDISKEEYFTKKRELILEKL